MLPGRRDGHRLRARALPRPGPAPGQRARFPAQQGLRHDQYGLDTAVDVGLQADGDAVPLGELGDDVQPDAAVREQARDVDLVGVGEQGVHPALLGDGHAESAVLDLHGEPGGDQVGPHQHLGLRGGEQGGVLDEFGEQVDDVGDGVAAQGAVDRGDQPDP